MTKPIPLTQWLPLAVLSVIAAALYVAFGIDALAAAPGLAVANVGALDLKQTIDAIKSGVDSIRGDTEAKFAELRRELERLEAKGNLQGLVGAGNYSASSSLVVKATEQERKAFDQYLRTGDKSHAIAAKAVSVGVPGEGGVAVPTWFDTEVHSMLVGTYPLLGIVRRRRVRNFPSRHILTDRGMAFGLVGEKMARAETGTPGVIAVDPPHGDFYANPQLTQWAIDDISFDAVAWIQREISRALGTAQQQAVVAGNGVSKARGFLDMPTSTATDASGSRPHGTLQYFPTGVAGALPATTSDTINLLLDVVHGTHQYYRSRGTWVMAGTTLSLLRRMKDADGRPLLLDSLINREPATLLGYPVIECEDMPVAAANSLSIAFGDFDSGYVLDEHESGMRVVPDPYTNKPYVGFYSTLHFGGAVLDSHAIKLIKFSVF